MESWRLKTNTIAFTKRPEPGETIVKLKKGKGEPPLSHGCAGLAFDFRLYPEKFRIAVSTVQVTPGALMMSLESHVAFHRRKIKDERPTGPYRAGYSASSILTFLMTQEFERHRDTVSHLAAPTATYDEEAFGLDW
ncbi:hypothetical protein ARMGADRAFT_79307 [Armillaria gallica]|uniref:Uncharacterized protein n=1 Tax=Armillaria gallica TaxID=47427 RepID=A0A2H3CU95_ARMGA|nr:hypothetical protein ARMGADRAFT_79307 [Armillaria gallica]